MFFNISNHPCNAERTTWSKEQIETAAKLGGEVVDLPFPAVNPDMSEDEYRAIAHEMARDVAAMWRSHTDGRWEMAAMVAGEYVMTIMVIAELQALGFTCYFGQSDRVAEERMEDGKLVVVHKFVFRGFRRAPYINAAEM